MIKEAASTRTLEDLCRELTWDQLTAWSSRRAVGQGRNIQYKGAVSDLRMVDKGAGLLAWVDEEEPFAVLVELADGKLAAECTCNPLVAPCEHAVAAIIEYILYLKQAVPVPGAPNNDPRFYLI